MARPRAALTLTDLTAKRGSTAAPPAQTPVKDARARRGQTLRLEPEAWRQLKMLALDQGRTSHDLLIEAVNLLFDHYNRPTIAG
jgi:hypothetical protein